MPAVHVSLPFNLFVFTEITVLNLSLFLYYTNSRFLKNNKYGLTSNYLGNKSIFAVELSDNLHTIISQAAIESWI